MTSVAQVIGVIQEPARFAPKGIPALTGIRGIAAVYVFLTHYQPLAAAFLKHPEINHNSFMFNGFRGVDLFFVLSGFILMHVHSHDFDEVAWPQLRAFYILRFLRVYPLNTIVLLALLPIGLGLPSLVSWMRVNHGIDPQYHLHDFSAGGFVQTLFLAQTWTVLKLGEWNGPSWTLSAEVIGYVFFPFAAHRLLRQPAAGMCIVYAVASVSSLVALLIVFKHAQNNPTGTFGLVRLVFAFVAGMCLCRAFHLWQPRGWRPGTAITIASVAFTAVVLSFPLLNVLTVVGFGGLIFGLAYREGPVTALVESRLVMFLGKISFSFYLIHYMVLKLSYWLFEINNAQDFGLAVRAGALATVPIACIVAATLMHRYLERPFQRLAHRLAGRAEGPAGTLEAPPKQSFGPTPASSH